VFTWASPAGAMVKELRLVLIMKEHFQNIVSNTLNNTLDKLKGNSTAFQNKLRTFSKEVGGTFSLPQGKIDQSKIDPRFHELTDAISSFVTLPMIEVRYKQWVITYAGWLAPPPIGPMVMLSVSYPMKPSIKLAVANKQQHDLSKLITSAAIPTDKALREFLKTAMPDFHVPTPSAEDIKHRDLWMTLPESRTGVIELDHICKVRSSDAKLSKAIFEDWKARESYLKIANESYLAINGSKNAVALMIRTNADLEQLKASLEFVKSVLDRSYQLKISSQSSS
jgi:hypothetical protein